MTSYQIKITDKALKIFLDATPDCVRVSAVPGGCSGWKWTLETTTNFTENDVYFYDGVIVVDKDILNNVLGDVTIDYIDDDLVSQGFVFTTKHNHCGCGESFQPINSKFAQ